MGKSTPAPPDYEAAAEATAESDWEQLQYQTQANRPTQNTPWGTIDWTQDDEGAWTQNVTLSPDQQAALDAQMGLGLSRSELASGMMGRVTDEFGQPMDWDSFSEGGAPVDGGDYYGDRAGDALYGRATFRLDPQ